MALHKRSDFVKLCGLSRSGELSVYIKRGDVIASGKYIDDSLPENQAFLERRREIMASKKKPSTAPSTKQREPVHIPKPNKIPPPPPDIPDLDDDDDLDSMPVFGKNSLTAAEKVAKIEYLRVKTRIDELKEAKALGQLVPTDVIKNLVLQFSKGMTTAFHQAADNLITEFAHKKKLSSKDEATLRGQLTAITNKAVEESVKNAKKGLKHIIDEYTEVRGRGERK